MLTQSRNERGLALPLAIFALVIVGALVSSAFFIGTQENAVGKNAVSLQQAFQAAEAGVDLQVANWNPGALNGLPVGGVVTFNGGLVPGRCPPAQRPAFPGALRGLQPQQ
jgi:hypothetical protein